MKWGGDADYPGIPARALARIVSAIERGDTEGLRRGVEWTTRQMRLCGPHRSGVDLRSPQLVELLNGWPETKVKLAAYLDRITKVQQRGRRLDCLMRLLDIATGDKDRFVHFPPNMYPPFGHGSRFRPQVDVVATARWKAIGSPERKRRD